MAPDTEEARRALYREIVQSLTLMDDIFMTAVFQNSLPCVDLVLQIILEKPNLLLAERAGAFKNTEKGEIYMSSKWEQFVEEVRAEERERAMTQGMARGAENAYLSSIRAMMEKLSVTAEKAMDVLAIPQSEWSRYKAML